MRNPMVPGRPAFGRGRPGSQAIDPNTQINELAKKWEAIILMQDEIRGVLKGMRAKTKRIGDRRMR